MNTFRAFSPVGDATGPNPMINAELFTAANLQEVLEHKTEAECQEEQVPANSMMVSVKCSVAFPFLHNLQHLSQR